VRELKEDSSMTSTLNPNSEPTSEPNDYVPNLPYDIFLSGDPFDNQLPVDIVLKGDDPTLGIIFQFCKYRNRLQLINMAKSTPGARVHKWRSNKQEIKNIDDLKVAIQQKRKQGQLKVTCCFATDRSFGIHPHHGIPQLYFDQLNIIAKHLKSINQDEQSTIWSLQQPSSNDTMSAPQTTDNPDAGQFFTKKELQKCQDWNEWQQSIYKMLDQYQGQRMFSDPVPLPKEKNALHMHWVYCLKMCGTRKARMVCNGSPRQKGTITLGHAYANALDAASERLFWVICAQEILIAIGADVSNAFAEAPPPILYTCILTTHLGIGGQPS
jgi:hypothetical protein